MGRTGPGRVGGVTYSVTLAFGEVTAGLGQETVTVTGQTADKVRQSLEMALEHNLGFLGDPVTVTITPEC